MPHVRRFIVLLALLLIGLTPARATPMLLVDMDTLDVLYAEDAGQPWYPASLTKMMTAYVVFEELANGTITLETPVVLSKQAIAQAPAKSGLAVGSALTLKDALYVMIVKSANDVATAIAETVSGSEAAFVVKMNDVATRMGLTASRFTNANGLHDPSQVTSARDMALLSLYIRQSFPQYMPMFGTEMVQQRLATGCHQLAEGRMRAIAIVERMVGGEPVGAPAQRGAGGPGAAAAAGARRGAQQFGEGAIVADRPRRRRIEGGHLVPQGGVVNARLVQLPVAIAQDRALGTDCVQERADQGIRATDNRPHRAQGGVDQHRVAALQAQRRQLRRQRGSRPGRRHRISYGRRRPCAARRPPPRVHAHHRWRGPR